MSAKPACARPSRLASFNPSQPVSRALLAAVMGASLLLPYAVQAEEPHGEISAATQVALHQPHTAGNGIRLKLHGIEDLRETEEHAREAREQAQAAGDAEAAATGGLESGANGDVAVSATDELKKQAQTRYLAAKLKKQEAAVRKYVDLAWAEAYRRDWLAPELLIAIIHKESSFRPKVQSSYGAQGLMQVVRRWHHDKLRPSESLFDPEVNIRVGADVLEEYLALANGDLDDALRKYSGNARNYANVIKNESRALAQVAERAATRAVLARG